MWMPTAICVQAVLFSGVLTQPFQSPGVAQNDTRTFAEQLGLFSMQLMRSVTYNNNDNAVLSPFSVATLLSLVQQAATGSSQKQLTSVLHLNPHQSQAGFHEAIGSIRKHKTQSTFENANAIVVNNGVNLNDNFRSVANNNYGAGVMSTDFSNSVKAAQDINAWVSTNTHDRIRDLISPNGNYAGLEMILLNALYFKGNWLSKFNPNRTTTRVFSPQPGEEIPTQFMFQSDKHNVGEDTKLGARWLEKPFDGEEFSMLFILPTEQHGLDKVLQNLRGSHLYRMISNKNKKNAVIHIPKFKLSTALSLTDALKRLGLTDIFDSKAHLEGLTDPARYLAISDVVHRAEIEIDEKGSRASAATGLVVNTLSLASYYDDFRFEANQPFLVVIADKINSIPLFVCRVNNPTR